MSKKTIKIQCKGADSLPLDAIVEFQGGLKKRGKKEINLLIKSIEKYGFSFPFMVWQNDGMNHCLDGHGRIQALAEMRRSGVDLPLFPVVYVDAKDEEEAKNKLLRLNSQYGQMTIDSVLEFTDGIEVEFEELMLHGDYLKIKAPESDTEGDDEAPDVHDEAVSQLGEIYELGPHRLMCGDSTDSEQVGRLMGGDTPLVMMTDPPYGVKLDQSWRDEALGSKALGKGNKNIVSNDDVADWTGAYKNFSGDIAYVWHASAFSDVIMDNLRSIGFNICQQIIWNKSIMVMGRNDYHFKHEPCWYAVRNGKTHQWTGDRKQTTIIDAKSPNHIFSGSDEEKTSHPTQKPVACMELIKNHGESGSVVYDPFGGSGTTLIAAAKTNRQARLMELDPKYCDVIRRRWTKWARENGHKVGSGGLEPIDAK